MSRFISRESVLRKLKERERYRKREQTVLAQLHDVFEEGEGHEFLGDPMWWRYVEDIDCDRIYQVGSIEFNMLRQMFFEFLFHVILLIFVTSYALDVRAADAYQARAEQTQFWGGCNATVPITPKEFREKITQTCDVEVVTDISSFWTWLDLKFLPLAYTPKPDYGKGPATLVQEFEGNEYEIAKGPRKVGDAHRPNAIVLGSMRLRQIRVQRNQGCTVSSLFAHIFTNCRAPFAEMYQSTGEYAAEGAPSYTAKNYEFREAVETGGTVMTGKFADYPAGGYVVDLPLYETEAHVLVHDLWNYAWLDSRTRAVVIEFSLLNTNVNAVIANRMLFEFSPTGNVKFSHEVNAWPVWYLEFSLAGGATNVFLQTILLCGLTCYLIYTIGWFIRQNGLKFFGFGWNFVDMAIVFLWVLHLLFRFSAYGAVASEINFAPTRVGHPELFMPFTRAVKAPLATARTLLAFILLLVWGKTLKYLALFKGFRILIRVMERALVQLVSFSLVILVIFYAFAVGFYVAFGATDERFSSLDGSFLVLFFYLLSGFELELSAWFLPGQDLMRPLMFFVYLLLTYFILVNVFMAIVLDAFTLVVVIRKTESSIRKKLQSSDASDERNPLMTFLYTYYHFLRRIDLLGDEEEKADEKVYQFIDLEDLPGIVSKKWLSKKRRMMETIARVNGEEPKPRRVEEEMGEGDEDMEPHYDEYGNLVIPDEHIEEIPSASQSLMAAWVKIKESLFNSLRPASQKALQNVRSIPVTIRPNLTTKGLYIEDPYALAGVLGRPQLQRLLNEDKALRVLLGTGNALDVIKRFKYMPNQPDSDEQKQRQLDMGSDGGSDNDSRSDEGSRWEPENENAAISALQELIFARLDKLEKGCLNVDQLEVPPIKFLSAQLADLLSDVQNSWREGIISVLESATGISGSLLAFTKGIEDVSVNHNSIMECLCVEESDSEGGEEEA